MAYLGHKLGIKLSLTAEENLKKNFNDVMGIKPFAHKLVERLSAGQKQRVALTRIVNSNAKLWVLDEPFTALDKNSIALFEAELQRHLRAGNMAVISSHQPLMLSDVQTKTLNLSEQNG